MSFDLAPRPAEEHAQAALARREFLALSALGLLPLLAPSGAGAQEPSAAAAHPQRPPFPFVDGLCFLPEPIEQLRDSGLAALVLDVSAGEQVKAADGSMTFERTFEACARSMAHMRRFLREHAETAFLATRGGEVKEALAQGRTAIFFQMQGCDPIGKDLSRIDLFYELGLRVLQITHHFDNAIGGGALEKAPTGLTPLGFEAVARMNEIGIVPDLSHASEATMKDVLAASKRPVIISHGAARALVDNPRCASDEAIRGIAKSGGMIGIFMMSFWLTAEDPPTVEHLIRQIRHVIDRGGIDAVGIANDYPASGEAHLRELHNDNAEGVKAYHPWWQSIAKRGVPGYESLPKHVVIPELNDITRMFTIERALERAGFSAGEREKIMGGNWVRVLTGTLG